MTWSCTGSPCPWGGQTTGHAVVWPTELGPIRTRHGYTTSADIYAPGTTTTGYQVTVHTGTARIYAGTPSGNHRRLATLAAGETTTLPTLETDEVFSAQSDTPFTYTLTPGTPADPADPPDPPDPADPPEGATSELVTWSCTGSPCPWGGQTTGHAVVWPTELGPIRTRHGYTTSADIYAPGTTTTGYQVTVHTGTARIYAGTPSGNHRPLATLAAGETTTLPTLETDEVFSAQSDTPFTYTLTPGTPAAPACREPLTCDPVDWTPSFWICNQPGCTGGGSPGGVISWPSWSAHESNGRSAPSSWTVYDEQGEKLYPYMGPWAEGCRVTVRTGEILVIEWERGTDRWRETLVRPGETHTIHLVGSENGAMLETPNNTEPFTASISHCTPQPIDKG